jgi:hypothetical protein
MKTSFEKFMASSAVQPVELSEVKVELAYTADNLVKDAATLKTKIDAAINAAARFSFEYDNMVKTATSIGVVLPANIVNAGKFVKAIENIKY